MRALVVALLGLAGLLGSASEGVSQSGAPTDFQRSRTARMLDDRLACLGCHQIGPQGGSIGPTLNGLGDRASFDQVLSMILDPNGTIPGTLMPRQSMPDQEARRLAAYLLANTVRNAPPLVQAEAPQTLQPADSLNGAALYARHCAACHGDEGAGDGWNAAALPVRPTAHADSALMSLRPDDSLYDAIAGGAYVLDGSPRMPMFGEMLSPDQIRSLVTYMRALCGCEGPPWSREGNGS